MKYILILLLTAAALLPAAAFAGGDDEGEKPPTAAGAVIIRYVGNSCFLLKFPDGTTIVTDPYGSSFASSFAPFPEMTADAVTVSHDHADHKDGIVEINGQPLIIRPGDITQPVTVGRVTISAFITGHVLDLGKNAVFIFTYGDFKIVHMAEAELAEAAAEVAAYAGADVVLAYTGNLGRKKNREILAFMKKSGVGVLVPQHFSMHPEKPFYGQPTLDRIKADLPEGVTAVALDELRPEKGMKNRFVVLKPMGTAGRASPVK